MNPHRLLRVTAAVAVTGAVAIGGSAAAPAQTAAGTNVKITASGAGGVKLKKTYTALRKQKLIGKIGPGCELAGPQARSARLRAPLKGSVDFTDTSPRKVANIYVIGGATARGVGIGATIEDIQVAFPKAKIDHSTEETFAITLVRIPKSGGGKLEFAVETSTNQVSAIGIPGIPFCE
jgi:hypothetical protein